MNIDHLKKSSHKKYIQAALGDSESEFEFVYGIRHDNKLSKQDFIKLLNIFRHKYKSLGESNTLDINRQIVTLKSTYLSDIRCTIEGIKDIQKYCKENKIEEIDNVTFMEKSKYMNPRIPEAEYSSIFSGDYNFKINLKKEKVLYKTYSIIDNYLKDFDTGLKYFRYKKRYSFITKNRLFRIDLTAVKTSNWNHSRQENEYFKSFLESNILKNEEKYELEIEYIGSNEEIDIQTNETTCAIDDFIATLSTSEEGGLLKKYENQSEYQSNVYSELPYVGEIIEDKEEIEPMDDDEFAGEYVDKLFPTTFSPITSDPYSDIILDYWVNSENEWLYEVLSSYNKILLFEKIEKNITGNYKEAPIGDYVIYKISPDFTDEEKEEIKDFPEDYVNHFMVPIDMIINTSESKKTLIPLEKKETIPDWAPKKSESRKAFNNKTKDYEKIEKIIKKRKKKIGVTIEYLVKWENTELEDEWKTEGELPDAQKMIRDYNNTLEKIEINEERREGFVPEIIDPMVKAEHIRLTEGYPLRRDNSKIQARKDGYVIDNFILFFNGLINDILVDIHGTKRVIPKRKKDSLIEIYHTLTEQLNNKKLKEELEKLNTSLNTSLKNEKDRSKQNRIRYNIREVKKKIKPTRFLGPQPISMSTECVVPENPHSILSGYVVTEKADGIRAQLLISYEEGYLITSKLDVIDTGLRFENCSGLWLFDGEYITKNIKNEDIQLYMIFDVYYASDGGKEDTYPNHAYTYPWISRDLTDISRSKIIHSFRSKVLMVPINESVESIRIDFKNYLEGPKELKRDKKDPTKYTNLNGMGKVSKKILDISKKRDNGFEYEIDGLIYLPMFLSVGSMNEGEIKNSIGGTWSINYKWKPPEENTIDFRIKIKKQGLRDKICTVTKGTDIIQCKEVELWVDYRIFDDHEYNFCKELLKDNRSDNLFQKNEILFMNNKNIGTTKIKLTNGKMLCLKDKVEIQHNMIVEMRYTGDNELTWEPLKYRKDKNNRAQYFTIANKIWNTIQEPVTEKMITGKELDGIEIKEKVIDNYYVGGLEEMKQDKPLKKFHNYIKSKLIEFVCSLERKTISIMDTSIGQGGDIQKYLRSKNRINFLFALDISPDINRAANRYFFEKMRKPKSIFMQYDTSEIITQKTGLIGENKELNSILIDILYEKNRNIPKEYSPYMKRYGGLGKRGFDVISSQFSFHYYCKDELSLRNYMSNLSENCKTGGYFIGTCYDGNKVFQLLKDKELIEMKDEFGNVVYSIQKKYDIEEFQYKEGDPENNMKILGNKIDVYMNSIGQTITEYLVNFEYIIKLMKEYDFDLYSGEGGKDLFNQSKYNYTKGIGEFEQILKDLRSIEDQSLKRFYSESFELLNKENQELVNLSSLNNWFIFQKK